MKQMIINVYQQQYYPHYVRYIFMQCCMMSWWDVETGIHYLRPSGLSNTMGWKAPKQQITSPKIIIMLATLFICYMHAPVVTLFLEQAPWWRNECAILSVAACLCQLKVISAYERYTAPKKKVIHEMWWIYGLALQYIQHVLVSNWWVGVVLCHVDTLIAILKTPHVNRLETIVSTGNTTSNPYWLTLLEDTLKDSRTSHLVDVCLHHAVDKRWGHTLDGHCCNSGIASQTHLHI